MILFHCRQLLLLLCLGTMNQSIDCPESVSKRAWYDQGCIQNDRQYKNSFLSFSKHLGSFRFALYWYSGWRGLVIVLIYFSENVESFNWSGSWEGCVLRPSFNNHCNLDWSAQHILRPVQALHFMMDCSNHWYARISNRQGSSALHAVTSCGWICKI